MSLFPQLGPQYLNEEHQDVLKFMEEFYADSIAINQSFWAEADTDTRFEAGDQTLWNDLYGNLPSSRNRQFNFNRIRRVKNMISGHQRRNRTSTITIPVENGDEETADQFTKTMIWLNQQEGVLETISDAFDGALVTGLNMLHVWMDYRSDPVSGNIKVDNCSYNSFLIDPYFRKKDLSDCNGLWKRSFITKRDALSLLPDKAEDIVNISGNPSSGKDGKFQFMPEAYNLGYKNLLSYDEFYYRAYRNQKMLIDTQTGESIEWKGKKEQLGEFLSMYPQVTEIDQEIPTVRLAIVLQGKVMYDGPNPMGIDKYPFVPVFGYYNPQMPYFPWRVQGVVRGLRDAQYLYNRRRVIELDILESQLNSGIKAKENALVNPKDALTQTGQGKILMLKEEAMMSDVEFIQAPQIPPSMIQLSELLANEINQISGVNEELLGSAVDDKAGVLSMLRQGAGLTTLQNLFDQLEYSQKLLGKLVLDLIQVNFTPGKVKRIIAQEPTPQFYNKAFGVYDVAIEEGFNTSTQRQMQFAQLLQLRETGIQIPDDIILDAATIQNKKELKERINAQNEQQNKMAEMQTQVTLAEVQARTELSQARAIADKGLGFERASRVDENKALAEERRAEAVKDRQVAVLDMAKTMKELESIDINNLQKFVSLLSFVQQQEQQVKESSLQSPLPEQAASLPYEKQEQPSGLEGMM